MFVTNIGENLGKFQVSKKIDFEEEYLENDTKDTQYHKYYKSLPWENISSNIPQKFNRKYSKKKRKKLIFFN